MRPLPTPRRLVLALIVAAAAIPAIAATGQIKTNDAWIRLPPPGAKTVAGYVTIDNRGTAPDRLMSADSPMAASVSLHQSMQMNGMASMKPAASVAVPAKGRLVLEPGGYHLMLVGVKGPLRLGQQVPVTLRFESAGAVEARFTVREAVLIPAGPATHSH